MNMWHRANAINLFLISILSLAAMIAVCFTHLSPAKLNPESLAQIEETEDAIIEQASDCTKDFWINKGGKRFQYHLESPSTRIILKNTGLTHEIVEEMDDMRLWMQDRFVLSPRPMQEVRFIQSPLSTFHFAAHELKTKNSFIALYSTPGKELSFYLKPELVSLRGYADAFDIYVDKEGVKFSATGFSAQIIEQGDQE